jgi:hypothetical protein
MDDKVKKSAFEKPWFLPTLIFLSVGLIGSSVVIVKIGKDIPTSFYVSGTLVIIMWFGYIKARIKGDI